MQRSGRPSSISPIPKSARRSPAGWAEQAPVGTLVSVAGAPLNTLVQLDPIYVTFNPSETDLATIQKGHTSGEVAAEIFCSRRRQDTPQGQAHVHRQHGRSADRHDHRAGDDRKCRPALLPGQYVRIRIHAGDEANALMVPQTALGSSQLGKYVYVVGDKNIAQQKLVTTGPTDGDLISVAGVNEKDLVITGNLQKIGPGSPVQPLTAPPPQAKDKAPLTTGTVN